MTDAATVEDLLARLAEPHTTVAEAEALMASLDGHEVAALPAVFRQLHDATTEAPVYAAARLLARWSFLPLAVALRPALRALLAEPAVGDLNKLAAAGLLERMGEPVDEHALGRQMRDPAALARQEVRAVLAAGQRPAALVNLLDALCASPEALVLDLIDDLIALADPRAATILGALTHDARPEVALAAVAAIDLLHLRPAVDWLALAAQHHPDAMVRAQGGRTLIRLDAVKRRERSAGPRPASGAAPAVASPVGGSAGTGRPRPPAERSAPVPGGTRALMGARQDGGTTVVMLARPSADTGSEVDVLTLVLDAGAGVREYAVAERLAPAGLSELLARLAEQGIEAHAVSLAAARRQLRQATARALAGGGTTRLGHLAWAAW